MDELNERLSEILNDPESMEKVRIMAENLLGGEESGENGNNADSNGVDTKTLAKISEVISHLKNGENDNRTALLTALKPHLSEERQHKVDTAVKLLRLVELLPHLKESGLLDFL